MASRMSACCGLVPTTRASRSMALPGTLASSTMVRTSEVGRLSTTYQPWSSRSAAALVRPAPDRPVITTMSAIPVQRTDAAPRPAGGLHGPAS